MVAFFIKPQPKVQYAICNSNYLYPLFFLQSNIVQPTDFSLPGTYVYGYCEIILKPIQIYTSCTTERNNLRPDFLKPASNEINETWRLFDKVLASCINQYTRVIDSESISN